MSENTALVYDRTSYILIVDDDNTLLKFFKIHLNKFYSKVVVLGSAKEAMEWMKGNEVDLVISDLKMPKVEGIELMHKVRKYDTTVPVLLISGAFLDKEEEKKCYEESDGFLHKPFAMEELHEFIKWGVKKRELFKELSSLVHDKKHFRDLLKGDIISSKQLNDPSQQKAAQRLLEESKKIFA